MCLLVLCELRMMGVLIDGPAHTYGDNMSVIHNMQRPESVSRKKSNSVCCHAVREAAAMEEMSTTHMRSEFNAADICKKIITNRPKRDRIVRLFMHYIGE